MCFAKLFDRRFIGGMREVFVLHASSKFYRSLQVTCWGRGCSENGSHPRTRRILVDSSGGHGGRSKLRMVQVSDVGIFITRYPNKIITWFFAKVQERVILESDFVRGFRPVDPERILLGDVTRDVG